MEIKRKMNSRQFREELLKIMPGYSWTVHRSNIYSEPSVGFFLRATGIKTSGKNRASTLEVGRSEKAGSINYTVRSAGLGTKAPWLAGQKAPTLARALRQLQDLYETLAAKYSNHAYALRSARPKKITGGTDGASLSHEKTKGKAEKRTG